MKNICKFLFGLLLFGAGALAAADNRPIGVFDSGTGGLTVLEKMLTDDFAHEKFVYLGDQANMPYGDYAAAGKSDFLRGLVIRDAEFLLGKDAKIIVIACNTATAYGYEAVAQLLGKRGDGTRVIGVVNAGARSAIRQLDLVRHPQPCAIGVLATPGTIASGVYERTIKSELGKLGVTCEVQVFSRGCAGLADAVEAGSADAPKIACDNLKALLSEHQAKAPHLPLKAVILGCTHFPFVQRELAAAAPKGVIFVDPAVDTAAECAIALKEQDRRTDAKTPMSVETYVSVAAPGLDPSKLDEKGGLTRAWKYGRTDAATDRSTVPVPIAVATKGDPLKFIPFAHMIPRVKSFLSAVPIAEPIQYWTPAGTNSWVGDVTVVRYRDRLHVFYLYDERHHQSFNGCGGHVFKHLSSADLKTWVEHPVAVGRDEPWEWIGTGSPLAMGDRLCLFYGLHSDRNGPGWERKYPKGGSYAVSTDGIHFAKSHDIFTDDENPSPFRLDDGRLGIIHSFFSKDRGLFAADRLAGPWLPVDDRIPTEGDCPCPFAWNGWHYVIQGFVTMAASPTGKPGSYEDWVLSGDDVYGGLSVPMVADWKDGRRLLVGWINGLDRYGEVPKDAWKLQVWGGWLCFRELVQFPDGRLGTKWLAETPNRGETRSYDGSPDRPFELTFRNEKGGTVVFRIDPKAARAEFSEGGAPRKTLAEVARALDPKKGRRIRQISGGALNAPYTAQNYAIGKIRGLDRPFKVRFSVYYDPKADGTVFDAEIAGTRTMLARASGRYRRFDRDAEASNGQERTVK